MYYIQSSKKGHPFEWPFFLAREPSGIDPVRPGQAGSITMPVYAGPQDLAQLEKVAPGLELVVDYG